MLQKFFWRDIAASLLAIATDSDLGNNNSLDELSNAVTPRKKQTAVTSIIVVDESLILLLQKLTFIITQASDKVKIVDVTSARLKTTMGWNHELEYNLEDDDVKNNFVLVGTSMLESVWNTYHARGDKAPNWCYNFAKIVQEFDENGGRQILMEVSHNQTRLRF